MPHLFKVILQTQAKREVNVVSETPEEAQTKVTVAEGEAIVEVQDNGEVTM